MTATRPQTYDAVARALHWLTVLGFIGILSTITVWTIYDGEEWVKSLFGVHKSIGFITLLVIAVRIVWALLNASKRPAADSFAAKAGHLALYVLMLAVPVIGMIRQYGSGRGPLKVFGVEVMQGSPEKNRMDGQPRQYGTRQTRLAALRTGRRPYRHGRRPPHSRPRRFIPHDRPPFLSVKR